MRTSRKVSVLAALLSAALACNFVPGLAGQPPAGTPTPPVAEPAGPILDMVPAASLDDQGQPVGPTFTFSPDAPQITILVQVGKVTGSPLDIVWYKVTDDGAQELFKHTVEVRTYDRAYSVGKNPGILATGTYGITATLEGKTQAIEWAIAYKQEAQTTGASVAEPQSGQPPTAGNSGTIPQPSGANGNQSPWSSGQPTNAGSGTPSFMLTWTDYRADLVEFDEAFENADETGYLSGTIAGPMKFIVAFSGQTAPIFKVDPCSLPGGSDLPGTVVKFEWHTIRDQQLTSRSTSGVTLGDDTLAPLPKVISSVPRKSKVKTDDQIVLTVTAVEARSGGPWQSGVQSIQVHAEPGGTVDSKDYSEYRGKSCEGKSWQQTFEATYTVPPNPPKEIELCAIADDFAGNQSSNCGTFYTTEHWQGAMHSEGTGTVPGNSCNDAYDTTLEIDVAADGSVSGEGRATVVSPIACTVPPAGVPPLTAATLRVEGHKYDDRFEIRLFPVSMSGKLDAGFHANWISGGGLNPPTQVIPITTPGVVEAEVIVSDSSSAELAGGGGTATSQNTYHLKCATCGQGEPVGLADSRS